MSFKLTCKFMLVFPYLFLSETDYEKIGNVGFQIALLDFEKICCCLYDARESTQ